MSRRALLMSTVLAAATLAVPAAAAPTTFTAKAWTWTALPGSGGAEAFVTVAVALTWTVGGVVTADYPVPLTVATPAMVGVQHVAPGRGYGLAVRKAGWAQ